MLVRKGQKCAWLNVATVTVCVKQIKVKVIFKFWEVLQTQIRKKVVQTQTQKKVTKVLKTQTQKKVTIVVQTQTQKEVTKVVQTQTQKEVTKVLKTQTQKKLLKKVKRVSEEIEVPRKSIPIYEVDSSSNSEKTEDIYKSHMDGSKISLATVSTVSTVPYTQSDESVEVSAKTPVTEQSTTIPYSQSDKSIQFVLEEESKMKKKVRKLM